MRHARDANELLEIASDELRAVVGDDSRLRSPVALPPVIELAGSHAQPQDEPSDADPGLLRPASEEIHD